MARVRTAGRAPEIPGFGPYLGRLMDSRGLGNVELGKLSGVNRSIISRMRSGVDAPSPATLRKLAPLLGVRFGDLLVAADLATREELGMVGARPAPGPALPLTLRRIVARLLKMSSADQERLLRVIDYAVQLYDQTNDPVREPNFGAGRPRARRTT